MAVLCTRWSRRLIAEGLGTAVLVATVVGSGIMAVSTRGGVANALLVNTIPTCAKRPPGRDLL
ncbi:MAG: hypothetical protein ACWA6X_10160 [Bauldia sp.]